MHILELLNRLIVIPNIKVVIPPLPELCVSRLLELSRNLLLQDLHHNRELSNPRLTYQQMHMFRHDNIPSNNKAVPPPDLFQFFLEDLVSGSIGKKLLSPITTKSQEVELA